MGLSLNRATISVAAAATGTLVAAVTNRQIHVHGYSITADTLATVAEFEDGGGATLSGNLRLPDEGSITALPPSFPPLFSTPPGSALALQATTGAVSGYVLYSLGP